MISENTDERRKRGRPRTQVTVEEAARLHLPSMLKANEVVPGETIRTSWSIDGRPEMAFSAVAEMKADRGRLVIRHSAGQHYVIEVVSDPQPYGGRRWWLVCPVLNVRTSAIYLPLGATRFASRQAHGLAYRTQTFDARGRAAERAKRLGATNAGDVSEANVAKATPVTVDVRRVCGTCG